MKENKCKHLEKKTKIVITKIGVLYGYEYKCELKSENYVSAKKICCRRCPKQLELFNDDMKNERLNR